MSFNSILSPRSGEYSTLTSKIHEPPYFEDLNILGVIEDIIKGREEYDLREIYFQPLNDIEHIKYRQDVIMDVSKDDVCKALFDFSSEIKKIHNIKNNKEFRYYKWQQLRWDLRCIELYCDAIKSLNKNLSLLPLCSEGMKNFMTYISNYTEGEYFICVCNTVKEICDKLERIKYLITINGDTVYVKKYKGQRNFSDEILSLFSKFKQHENKQELELKKHSSGMNHVEGQILDRVARLFPGEFSEMEVFLKENESFFDKKIKKFHKEIQFYLSFNEYMVKLKGRGVSFCIPSVERGCKKIFSVGACDLALAGSLLNQDAEIIKNNFTLDENEKIILISGPNQGGKTTFARMIGQIHYFALLGIYVPAERAGLYLVDCIYTHFEKSENINNLRGKLYDDLVRIKLILDSATPHSLIIMNEIFTSTTSRDATYLAKEIIRRIIELGALSICVTFIDELTELSPSIISMMSTVDEKDINKRTFRIIRKDADGAAYSATLVKKYSLTYEGIKMRVRA